MLTRRGYGLNYQAGGRVVALSATVMSVSLFTHTHYIGNGKLVSDVGYSMTRLNSWKGGHISKVSILFLHLM